MSAASNFSDLYKSRNKQTSECRQSVRRQKLLDEQRAQRNKGLDDLRGIDNLVKDLTSSNKKQQQQLHNSKPYRNQLQLSEWLLEKPDDLQNWYLVPCPKGMRCLLIAHKGRTEVYSKNGYFMEAFRSRMPGDFTNRQSTTILDCIFIKETLEYYVLDCLAYADQDMISCEAEFRFYWINSKIDDEQLSQIDKNNEFSFRKCQKYNCGDDFAVEACLSKYPMWENSQPALDGLLFYHKESSYVHGKTPLVGWLYPFMVPDVMNFSFVNASYISEKPDDYTDYLTYIRKFDEEIALKRRQRGQRNGAKGRSLSQMDVESIDDPNSVEAIISAEQCLELEEDSMNEDIIDHCENL